MTSVHSTNWQYYVLKDQECHLTQSLHIKHHCTKANQVEKSHTYWMGWDSSVGIVTRYGLDGPCEGKSFSTSPDWPWGLLYNGYQVPFWRVKRPVCGINHPPPSSAEDKERVELYLYFPSGLCMT
jgi:hypothetical protein